MPHRKKPPLSFAYNAAGIRTQKNVHGVVSEYFLDGSTILAEKTGNNVIWYIYDTAGELLGFTYNGTPYYYLKNQQGDVYKIVDANGTVVGSYTYDPWGKVLKPEGPMADINPIRYRSYYYDSETQLYYLQSRYYDPEIGRFINADSYTTTGQGLLGNNMFAYCNNNPISNIDPSGQAFLKVARQLLKRWLFGDGTKQNYGSDSPITKKVKKSDQMEAAVDQAIENYKNGQPIQTDNDPFTAKEDGLDLFLGIHDFEYTIDVEKETRTKGLWFWKHEEVRYVATVSITDKYNFAFKDGYSIAHLLNNSAYLLHKIGVGNDYEFEITYTYATKWEKNK